VPVGFAESLNVVERVVVGDELQCVGDAFDQIVLPYRGHGFEESSWLLGQRTFRQSSKLEF
jgi:hypothetical protein